MAALGLQTIGETALKEMHEETLHRILGLLWAHAPTANKVVEGLPVGTQQDR